MVDTDRTIASLQSLLADNTTGDISAQDVRDLLVSLSVKYGDMYVSTPAATTISNTTSYFDAAGTWTAGSELKQFDMNTNGQLRYIGTPSIEVVVFATASITVAGSNDVIHLEFRKNGTDVAGSDAVRKVGTGSDVGAFSVIGITGMATNDYITIAFRNETAADNVTAEEAHVLAIGLAI
jgi:hypothetical protein